MPIHTRSPITRCILRLIPLFILVGFQIPLLAQCSLSCNSGLQVSLDPTGQALITPLLLAPNSGNSCPGPLTVTLYNPFGQQLPNPLTCSQIGQTVTARVRHTSSGNYCDGTLELFDALSPTLSNCDDQYIFCHEDASPGAVNLPAATDNCTPPDALNFSHFDLETPLNCGTFQNGVPVLKRIDRNWTVTDDHGNSSTCLQRIWLKHMTLADISFPLHRDNISSPALHCGQDPDDFDLTGQPTVNGIPVGASPECELAVTHSDQTIVHCAPAGYTVLRTWTAVDFCSGTISNRIQLIKVVDQEVPQLTAPDDLSIGTDGFYCTGSVTLPQAVYSDNCSAVTVVPSWDYGTGYGPFSGITEGVHLVTYTATDACGNIATATMTITVADSSPPQAICAADLQVSLSSNGVGLVHASTANAGSFDNCSPVFFSISRDELIYGPWVAVTCADQGTPIPLTLRVTDAAGLENFCQMEVTVRDFLKPTVLCPPNLTLHCLQDYTNLSLTGQATASDNCALQSLVYQDILNIQPCNIGSVTRRWIATDAASNTKSCSQQITVIVVSSTQVAFPSNTLVASCGAPEQLLPAETGSPILTGESCSPLSVNYSDQIFSIAPPSCFRIFRTWKVVDHCIYNPNGGSAGIWESTQIIDVVDDTPPELTLPNDITVGTDPFGCTGSVNLSDVIATDCSSQISFSHDSPFSGAGNTLNASGQYPVGVHFITFQATDACGNSARQTLRITVQDQTPPSAVCFPGVSAVLDQTGTVTLDPHDFDSGCSDYCSPPNNLTLIVTPSVLDCQQIGIQTITLEVRDDAGNKSTCSTQVSVLDPLQICGNYLVHQVDGTIRTETGMPVYPIPVTLFADGFFEEISCDTTGYFEFNDVPGGLDYTLKPYNNAHWVNGVTTYDLVLISKHILGTSPLNSPYKILAADANHSGSITTFDILQLRKLILGILDSLPTNTSWRFVDSSFVFPDPQFPFASPIPEEIVFSPLNSDRARQNFIGIKVGDVNGSAIASDARSPQDTLLLRLPNREFSFGESFSVSLSIDDWNRLEGVQFELQIDPLNLELERVEFAQPELLGPAHIALKTNGSLAVSWNKSAVVPSIGQTSDARMLTLHFRGKADSDLRSTIGILSSRVFPEAYKADQAEAAIVAIGFEKRNIPGQEVRLEIYPNPGKGPFFIKNPFEGTFTSLRILDNDGKQHWSREGFLPETIEVRDMSRCQSGLYWVELKSGASTVLGKMIILD